MTDCRHPGCPKPANGSRGYCHAHYWRLRNGKPMDAPILKMLPATATLQERLYARIDPTDPDACWEWQGTRRKDRGRSIEGVGNYGRMGIGGDRSDYAHRVSWRVHFGPIPDGMHVLHSCDNPPCVNPAHLRLGTERDNKADSVSRGRHYTPFGSS